MLVMELRLVNRNTPRPSLAYPRLSYAYPTATLHRDEPCIHLYTHVNMHAYTNACAHACTLACTPCLCACPHTCPHTCLRTCLHMCADVFGLQARSHGLDRLQRDRVVLVDHRLRRALSEQQLPQLLVCLP